MGRILGRLRRCRRGATAVEYGFIVTLICLAVVALIGSIGGKTQSMWTNLSNSFTPR